MRSYVKKISQKAEKLSKEQLISLLDELVIENESLYSIMESMQTGMLIVDNEYKLQRTNHIAESRLNFNVHLDESNYCKFQVWDLIDEKEIADFIKNCAEKGITNSSEDFSTVTEGGTVRFISVSINPLLRKADLCGRIILIHDITDRKNQDVLVHRMENMANLTNLAAGMAHDIKNPLGAISIHIQLIQKALEKARSNNDILPPKKFVEDHIDVVNEEIEHLNNLVMDFLFAVRPVNATLLLKNPAELIKNLVEFIKPEFNRFNIEVLFKEHDSEKIMIDEKLLREVIMNLSQNALAAIKSKFTECQNEIPSGKKGEFAGRFGIECYKKGIKYIIKISDNGCGMSPQTVSRIFEPYFTTKSNGTGLGMTMVYKIIKEFAGEIQVESEEGTGSDFIISLPIPQDNKKLLK